MNKIDGRYLRALREERGYSLRAFAEKIYASKSSVQRWEKSFVPENPDILAKISDIFNLSIDEMRKQSAAKYGATVETNEDTALSSDRLAELKFGTKWLTIPAICLSTIGIAVILIVLLL